MEQVPQQTNSSEQPFNPNKSQGIAIPTSETAQNQPSPVAETQSVDLNKTLVNAQTEILPIPQIAQPPVESAPVKQPNITEQSDHPLPFGTSFESLQAKVKASQAETKQVLLPSQPTTTETPATSFADKVKGWLKFGRK